MWCSILESTPPGAVLWGILQNNLMKLTLSNKILLALTVLLFAWQYRYATTSACPTNSMGEAYCWGPSGVEIFGINFNQGYLFTSLKIFVFSIVIAVIVSFIIQKLKNKAELKTGLVNLIVRIFGIVYILFSLAFLYSKNMNIQY